MAKDIVVFDLDGTIADIKHRIHLVQTDRPNWPLFFKECVNDVPNEWARSLALGMVSVGKKIVVVSARSQEVQKETEAWFAKHWKEIPHELNLIRKQGDTSPDADMKRAWLNASGIKDRILFIVDDRQRVVDMWRAEGMTCLQCAAWAEWKRPKKNAEGACRNTK